MTSLNVGTGPSGPRRWEIGFELRPSEGGGDAGTQGRAAGRPRGGPELLQPVLPGPCDAPSAGGGPPTSPAMPLRLPTPSEGQEGSAASGPGVASSPDDRDSAAVPLRSSALTAVPTRPSVVRPQSLSPSAWGGARGSPHAVSPPGGDIGEGVSPRDGGVGAFHATGGRCPAPRVTWPCSGQATGGDTG